MMSFIDISQMSKIKYLLILVIIFMSYYANGDSLEYRTPYHFNHVTVNLNHGFTQGTDIPNTGLLAPSPKIGYIYQLDLNYTTNYSPSWGLTFGTGFGAFPINFKAPIEDWGKLPYFDEVDYQKYGLLKGEINYRKRISKKYYFNGFTGLNLLFFRDYSALYEVSDMSQHDYLYRMTINIDRGWRPQINLGAGISKELKNGNLLCLRLDYFHSFSGIYQGKYIAMPNTIEESEGLFNNNGHHLNLGISYSFTFSDRFEKYQTHFEKTGNTDVKKPYKKELRKIDENSLLVSLSGGNFFPITKAIDPNGYFKSAISIGFVGLLNLEYQLKNNFYTELGFGLMEYYDAVKINGFFGTISQNVFNSYQFSLGFGKRLTGKKSLYNYLNLSAGATLNITDVVVGQNGTGLISIDSSVFESTSVRYGKNKISPMLYLSVSKDFRLSPGFFFSLNYRYNQGLLRIYEQDIVYTSINLNEPKNAVLSMNGSYHSAQLGFKFNIGDPNQLPVSKTKRANEYKTTFLSINQGKVYYRTLTKPEYSNQNAAYTYGMDGFATLLKFERYFNSTTAAELGLGFQNLDDFLLSLNFLNLSGGVSKVISLQNGLELIRVHGGIVLNQFIRTRSINIKEHFYNEFEETDLYYEHFYNSTTRTGVVNSYLVQDNDTIYSSNAEFGIQRDLIPGLYYSLSKEFNLTKKISFGILFSNQFTFGNFYYEINKTKDPYRGIGKETTTMNGRNAQLYLSLKYRIFK
jgi:hypothetical protein